MAKITRTVEADLTPDELGRLFANLTADEQAAFFEAVVDEARTWPNGGWSLQALYIGPNLSADAAAAVRAIAESIPA